MSNSNEPTSDAPKQDIAVDHFTGQIVEYPRPDSEFTFHFLFKRKGDLRWRYLNSFDTRCSGVENQIATAAAANGVWRIVSARCGFIVDEG